MTNLLFPSSTPCGLPMYVVKNCNHSNNKGLVVSWLQHCLVEFPAPHRFPHDYLSQIVKSVEETKLCVLLIRVMLKNAWAMIALLRSMVQALSWNDPCPSKSQSLLPHLGLMQILIISFLARHVLGSLGLKTSLSAPSSWTRYHFHRLCVFKTRVCSKLESHHPNSAQRIKLTQQTCKLSV